MYERRLAIRNGRKLSRHHDNISVRDVVKRLENKTAPAAKPGSKQILLRMSEVSWDLVEGVHPSDSDGTDHITVSFKRGPTNTFHLRLDRRGVIFDIVNGKHQRLAGRLPWVAPGA